METRLIERTKAEETASHGSGENINHTSFNDESVKKSLIQLS